MIDSSRLDEFATRYTAALCSHSASNVAAFYSKSGSLTINEGPPAVSRKAVEDAAQSFMTAYPVDLIVKFNRLAPKGDRVLYHWTFTGTNAGPGGTGNHVRISGFEDWKIESDGLIADSNGHYDAQEWIDKCGGIRRRLNRKRRLGRVRRIVASNRLSPGAKSSCEIKFIMFYKYLIIMPRRGLEPPRCYPLVPETSASTNSATWAVNRKQGRRRNLRMELGAVN
jgi:hypothetical protein